MWEKLWLSAEDVWGGDLVWKNSEAGAFIIIIIIIYLMLQVGIMFQLNRQLWILLVGP